MARARGFASGWLGADGKLIDTEVIEAQRQTAELTAWLRRSCRVCLVPHDPEIHAATLRLREPLPDPVFELARKLDDFALDAPVKRACAECGGEFLTMCPRLAEFCKPCVKKRQVAQTKLAKIRARKKTLKEQI